MQDATAPDGRRWTVVRRIVPWRPRWRGWRRDSRRDNEQGGSPVQAAFDFASEALFWADDLPSVVAVGLTVVAAAILLVVFVIPVALLLVELALVALFVVVGVFLSGLLGRPWIVEARTQGPPAEERRWAVRGWRRSRRARDEIAMALQAGTDVPQHPDVLPVVTAEPTDPPGDVGRPEGFLRPR